MSNPTRETAAKVLHLLSFGLVKGLGVQEPGKMCVEAAVCCALGLPHSDNPPCVGKKAVRPFKIALNDKSWSTNEARAKGMARLAIAQLGSDTIDESVFVKELALSAIKLMVPIALRAAAKRFPSRAEIYEQHALACEGVTEVEDGHVKARAAAAAADAAAYAAAAAAYAAAAAAYAAAAAADAAAAAAAAAYAAAAAADARDQVLSIMAEAGVQALIKAGSPGCAWLDLAPLNQ